MFDTPINANSLRFKFFMVFIVASFNFDIEYLEFILALSILYNIAHVSKEAKAS